MNEFMKKNWFGLLSALFSFAILVFFLMETGVRAVASTLQGLNPIWMGGAVVSILAFWAVDSFILHMLVRFKYKEHHFLSNFKTTMIGLLYNAITPFAMGGQPMQVYNMSLEGIGAGDASSFITIKTVLYQLCLTLYACLALVFSFSFFVSHVPNFVLFIVVGLLLNVVFITAIVMVVARKSMTLQLTESVVGFLARCRILKKPERLKDKITEQIELFHESSKLINREKRLLIYGFLLTAVQQTIFYAIPYCIYRSFNLTASAFVYILCAEAIITMITAFVPLPGASGAAEGSFYLFFAMFFTKLTVMPAIFLWRLVTYYSCILVGGAISLAGMRGKATP